MTHVFHRNPKQTMPVAVGGSGIELIDSNGRRYLDASGGAAVSCLGHGHPRVIEAIKAQVDTLAYAHTSFFTTEVSETLARTLAEAAPGDLNHVYFVSGGSEAVEAALKLARQYFVEIGQPQRRHFIARRQSYHGNTLGALAIGGNAWRREPFLPLLVPAYHVSPCYAYRDQAAGETTPNTRSAWPKNWKPRSSNWDRTPWPASSPRPWSAPRRARCPRWAITSSASAPCATSTACC